MATPERAVQVQHHVAEHVAHQQQPQEVVTEELQHAGLYKVARSRIELVTSNIGREGGESIRFGGGRCSSVLFLIRGVKVNAHIFFFEVSPPPVRL